MWLLCAAAALLVYGLTAHRGVQHQDSGWQQVRIFSGEIDHPLGLALTHPLQFHLGRLAMHVLPVDPPLAITLVSSFAGAVAVANIALIVWLLTGRRSASALAALSLLVAHTFWHFATHTESYVIVVALLTTEWLLIVRYLRHQRPAGLVALAAVNGLGVATHLLAILATPVNVLLIAAALWRKPGAWRWAALAAAAWLCGAAPYLTVIVREWSATGDLPATVHSALFGKFSDQVLNTHFDSRKFLLSLGYVAYNFPNLALPLALAGLIRPVGLPRWFRRTLLAELAVYSLFVLRYSIVDQYTFFLPVYALLAVHVGAGAAQLARLPNAPWRRATLALAIASVLLAPAIYVATAEILRAHGAFSSLVRQKPYRDGYRAYFIPWGVGEDSLERLTRRSVELAQPDGVILVCDSMSRFGVEYEQLCGRLPAGVEWRTVEARTFDDPAWNARATAWLAQGRPVVLVPSDREKADIRLTQARWVRAGDLYLLAPSPSAGEQPAEK